MPLKGRLEQGMQKYNVHDLILHIVSREARALHLSLRRFSEGAIFCSCDNLSHCDNAFSCLSWMWARWRYGKFLPKLRKVDQKILKLHSNICAADC